MPWRPSPAKPSRALPESVTAAGEAGSKLATGRGGAGWFGSWLGLPACLPACDSNRQAFCCQDAPTSNLPSSMALAAVRVLRLMLDWDPLGAGQRADLEFVMQSLEAVLKVIVVDNHKSRLSATGRFSQTGDEKLGGEAGILQAADLDSGTQAFLLGFSNRLKAKIRLKDVANAVRIGMRLRQRPGTPVELALEFTSAKVGLSSKDTEILAGLSTWNNFDVFKVNEKTGGKPLAAVGMEVMKSRDLVPTFNLPLPELSCFLQEIESLYMDNMYHNRIHAADVTHASHVLLLRGLERELTEIEHLGLIMAAVGHDVAHPGITNDFRVKNADEDAITYNDRSVNENMHCAMIYRSLQRAACNFVTVLSVKQRELLRQIVIGAVLNTDMSHHFSELQKLQEVIDKDGGDASKWSDKKILLEVAVHVADLSNASRPHALSLRWTDAVLGEMFAQGDQERKLGVEISPLCNRKTTSKPGSQVGFINFIVRPLMQATSLLCDAAEPLQNVQETYDYWLAELAKENAIKEKEGRGRKSQMGPS